MKDSRSQVLQARAAEALRKARKIAPGPQRNELRQIAKTLRALARHGPAEVAAISETPDPVN